MNMSEMATECVRNLRNRTIRLDREGDFWTDDERTQLENMFGAGAGITEMALYLQRTEPAIFQQIEKMDLYRRTDFPQRRRTDHCNGKSCLCCTCNISVDDCPQHLSEKERKEGLCHV